MSSQYYENMRVYKDFIHLLADQNTVNKTSGISK